MTGTTPTPAVWFVTGAARGMGIEFARAALEAGHHVVGTARDAAKVTASLGEHDNLLAVALDVTDPAAAHAAVDAAVERFGRIDTLVNNAGNFYAGFFEEISDAQLRAQLVSREVLRVELIGPPFIDYLAADWDDLVA